jgi:hypothetical protein
MGNPHLNKRNSAASASANGNGKKFDKDGNPIRQPKNQLAIGYSKPMFDREGVTSSSIYRPTRGEGAMDADEQYAKLKESATSRFQPDQGFNGAESGGGAVGGPRTAPVQFEKGESK